MLLMCGELTAKLHAQYALNTSHAIAPQCTASDSRVTQVPSTSSFSVAAGHKQTLLRADNCRFLCKRYNSDLPRNPQCHLVDNWEFRKNS